MLLLFIMCAVFALLSAVLAVRLSSVRRAVDEIRLGFWDRLEHDTNTLVDVTCRDRAVVNLASDINRQLKLLRQERRRYERGDLELKEAVTNISHDLRTPLTAICGYLDLMEREPLSEDARRYSAMIRGRTDAMRQMTEELFQYSVLTTGERRGNLELVSINSMLEGSLAAYYGAITARGIKPDIRMPEEDVKRLSDKKLLARIFENVLSNAVKYSGGDLSVSLDRKGTILFSNSAPFMDTVSVGRLFDRFYTVENGRSSTGLGLSIARALTERLGGTVSAELSGGRLTIILRFPKNI